MVQWKLFYGDLEESSAHNSILEKMLDKRKTAYSDLYCGFKKENIGAETEEHFNELHLSRIEESEDTLILYLGTWE